MIRAMLRAVWALTKFTIKATLWLALILAVIGLVIVFPISICAVPVIVAVISDHHLMR